MTLRTMLGIAWSTVCGLAGGWLVLMPWALGVQGGGDWTTTTKVSFGTGLGLLVFCLAGLAVTMMQIVRLVAPPRQARAAEPTQEQADQESLDRALLQLATKLVADLEAPAPAQAQATATESAAPSAATVAGAPDQNGISTRSQAPTVGPDGQTQGGSPTSGGGPTWRRVER